MNTSQYTNIAFISYKREDEEWAKWLQNKLEHYKLPTEIRKQNPDMEFANNPRHVFKDTTDLSGGVLAKAIKEGLDSSKFLIVICSPRAAKSEWVCKEVQDFIDSGREEYIIPFIIDGEPYAKNPENECFPETLKTLAGERELLGININENGRESAAVKVVSRVFDLRFDTLWNRFQREQKKRRRYTIVSLVTAIFVVACVAGYIWMQSQKIKSQYKELQAKNVQIEQQNKDLDAKSDSITNVNTALIVAKDSIQRAYEKLDLSERNLAKSNADLKESNIRLAEERDNVLKANWKMMENEQKLVAEKAVQYIQDGDILKGIALLKSVLPESLSSNDKPVTIEAIAALRTAYNAWTYSTDSYVHLNGHEGEVLCGSFNSDGTKIITGSNDKTVRIWDLKTFSELTNYRTTYDSSVESAIFSKDNNYVYTSCGHLQKWKLENNPIRVPGNFGRYGTENLYITKYNNYLSGNGHWYWNPKTNIEYYSANSAVKHCIDSIGNNRSVNFSVERYNDRVVLTDTDSKQLLASFPFDNIFDYHYTCISEDETCAAIYADNALVVRNMKSRNIISSFEITDTLNEYSKTILRLSPNNRYLLFLNGIDKEEFIRPICTNVLYIYDINENKLITKYIDYGLTDAVFSRDSKYVLLSSSYNEDKRSKILFFNLDDGKEDESMRLSFSSDHLSSFCFDDSGNNFMACFFDGSIRLFHNFWNQKDNTPYLLYNKFPDNVLSRLNRHTFKIDTCKDDIISYTDTKGDIHKLHIPKSNKTYQVYNRRYMIDNSNTEFLTESDHIFDFSVDVQRGIVYVVHYSDICLYKITDQDVELISKINFDEGDATDRSSYGISDDGNSILKWKNGKFGVFSNSSKNDSINFQHKNNLTNIIMSNLPNEIISSSYDMTIRFWNTKTNSEIHEKRIVCKTEPLSIAISHDGRYFAYSDYNNVYIMDNTSRVIVESISLSGRKQRLLFSPDNTKLFIESDNHIFAVELKSDMFIWNWAELLYYKNLLSPKDLN